MIDKTPKGKTIRKYFPDTCLTDDELYELAKWYAETAGIMFIKPGSNQGFAVLVKCAEGVKKWKSELVKNIEQHDEHQCWEDHDCLCEIIKWIRS